MLYVTQSFNMGLLFSKNSATGIGSDIWYQLQLLDVE